MGGKACIAGTRMTVAMIVRCVAGGLSVEGILDLYDYLSREDVEAALKYASYLADERVVPLRPTGS